MKGIIFNVFLDFVEQTMSYDMVDKIIMKSRVESGGAYTSIGNYNSNEFFRLVATLSEETGVPPNKLLQNCGEYLFCVFVNKYPQYFKERKSVFEFLSAIEMKIYGEVKKIYTDASPPHFQCNRESPNTLTIIYKSSRPLADLAEGIIRGCIAYHNENIDVKRVDFTVKKGAESQFTLIKRGLK